MKHFKLLIAFGLGFVTAAVALGFIDKVDAAKPDTLTALESRVRNVELAAATGHLPQTVTAPFEVIDPATRKAIFYVNDGKVEVRNKAGEAAVQLEGFAEGGEVSTVSNGSNLVSRLSAVGPAAGITVFEGGTLRVDLGRRPDKGTYRLLFLKDEKKYLAGIGQSEAGTGLAFVSDNSGNEKAAIRCASAEGKGLVSVSNADGRSLAEMTEGESGGGRLALFNNQGENMVIAGVDAGGFGVVRAGPGSFMPGYGTLGLPGSFISGKKRK